ncbi:MAG: hypothetical protein HOM52_00840 [Rhodospirillaceae bacterium]|nr:hypothetical protein [Rhodospirillaceae bacterium]MBT3928587.1 hypothetical protein [Rhodospirillaceae bacterium]MBT4426702.1 hypothetical protein [Rhodospirillaceae bacterium]MBT5037030.1 hypothetical protein [Rhodospirillaceae bacterium]MBT5677655.1 hypothetical protein [Rhodospirillaceae bacterium]
MLARKSEHTSERRTGDLCKYERISEAEKQLHIIVDGEKFPTINWSVNDCLVDGLKGQKLGDRVAGTIETLHAVPMGAFISEVVRIDDQGRAALRFITVAPLDEAFLK